MDGGLSLSFISMPVALDHNERAIEEEERRTSPLPSVHWLHSLLFGHFLLLADVLETFYQNWQCSERATEKSSFQIVLFSSFKL